jgi:sporulation protein YlmC with PRC-barrel domain
MSTKHYRNFLASGTLIGDEVYNSKNEHIGKIEELMIDLTQGKVGYAVMSFGGVFGVGNKFVDQDKKCLILNIDKEKFKNAPGFDKDHWPDMTPEFTRTINTYYDLDR